MAEDGNRPARRASRRRLLQGMGAVGAASLAGCLGGAGDDGGADGGVDLVQDRVTVDPEDVVEGGTFHTAIPDPIDTFDVPSSSTAAASNVHGLLYEGMVTTDASGELYPWLAASYERVAVQAVSVTDYEAYMISAGYDDEDVPQVDDQIVLRHPDNEPDSGEGQFLTVEEAPAAVADGTFGMHYRFDLHEGVEFHDGEELTADNVVASYERLQGSRNSGQVYDSLLDVQAEGDYTVDLYAQFPDAQAIRNLGGWEVYPTAATDLPPGEHDPGEGNKPLGTGPFTFEEYEASQYVTLSRNENYWFDTDLKDWFEGPEDFPNGPVVDEVDVRVVPDAPVRAAALRSGGLDVAYGLSAAPLDDFDQSSDYRAAATRGAGYKFLQFPVEVEPFTDVRIRRAINHLVPREDIAEEIFYGWETPAWVPMPPLGATSGTTDYDQLVEDLRSYNTYDRSAANSLVEEAVDDNGWDTPIQVTIETNSNNDDRVNTVEAIEQSLDRSDYFEASVDTYPDIATLSTAVDDADYAQRGVLAFIGYSNGFSPHGYAKATHHPDNYRQCCNVTNVDIPELNRALHEARFGIEAVRSREVRQRRYDEIWELVLEHCANSYSTHNTTVAVVRSTDIHGFNTFPSAQAVLPYGLYAPADEQITYVER